MNDLMSGGMHRLWKAFTIQRSGVREGSRVLDVAGGTGDLSLAFAKRVGKSGQVWLTDINNAMLARGRDRLLDKGYMVPAAQWHGPVIYVAKGGPSESGGDGTHLWKDCYFGPRPGVTGVERRQSGFLCRSTRHGCTLDNVTIRHTAKWSAQSPWHLG